MSSISFGGLVSGLDTNGIIDKLIAIEKQPITTYQKHQSDDNAKLSTLASLVTKVQALSDAANALATSSKANPVAATSSDSNRLTATSAAGATQGSYKIIVDTLAAAQANTSSRFATNAAPGDGSLSIKVGTNDAFSVSYKSGDKLDDIAASINNKAAGVVATVLQDGSRYRLLVTSTKTGLANAFTITESGASLGYADPGTVTTEAADASFWLNGINVTRASNHITDAIANVTLDLRSVTPQGGIATAVTVGLDQSALTSKVQSLVNAYNDVAKSLADQLAYNGSKKGSDTLFGDGTLRDLQRSIATVFAGSYGNNGTLSAAHLGVELQKDGSMSFDSSKFAAALGTDPTSAQTLFAGDVSQGLAQKLKLSLDVYTRAIDGRLVAKQDALKKDITNYDKLIAQTTETASKLEARLRKQYAAMEQALSTLQTQSGLISSLILGGTTSTSTSSSNKSSGSTSSSSS